MNCNKLKGVAQKVVFAFSVISLGCCSYRNGSKKSSFPETHQVRVFLSFPTLDAANKFIIYKDSLDIIYYREFVLYKLPYINEFSINTFDSLGEIIEHKMTKTGINFKYLIYKKGESHGYAFDSTGDMKGARVRVDSFVNDKIFIVDRYIFNGSDSLIKKITSSDKTSQEVYLRTIKNDMWDCDTNNLFFSPAFKGIDFSLSRKLDSIKNAKLFKVYQVSNGDLESSNPLFKQKREILMELKEIPIENNKEIVDFWNRQHAD